MIIVVKPGIYEEVVNNAPSDVALSRRLFLISETGDPATTFIRATPGTAGTVRSRKDLYLGGFTLYGVGQDGVSLTDSTVSAVAHCVIQGHRDGVAIGMSTVASRVDLINTLVSEPDTTTGRYAINAGTAAKLRLIHTTLTGHDMASTSGYGYSIYGPGSTAEITNSILWNGGATQIYGLSSVTVTRSCVRGASPPTGLGNTNADPLLVQGRPALGSTAINLGGATSLSEAKDIELNPRLFGPSPDAGCFEYQEAVPAGPPTAMDLTRITLYSGAGDFDGDGISDLEEQARGTDPLIADTDGDGVSDALDRYPLDPAATGTAGGADSTPPVISVAQPSGAVKL